MKQPFMSLARLKHEGQSYYEDLEDDWPQREIGLGYIITRQAVERRVWERAVAAPHVWIPKPIELVAAAAALAVVRNPIVTRRFWAGWSRGAKVVPTQDRAKG
jgi:hypothetical protein